jgi:hypothetical protein
MAILDSLKKMLGRGKTLDDIQDEDLKREKIRLDREEDRMVRQVEQLEAQKKQLFMKGKDETSERQRMIIARKIKELDVQARNTDRQMQFIARQLRVVNGFIQLKDNQRTLREAGLMQILGKMDLEQLQAFVERASIDGVFQMDKFQSILETIEDGQHLTGETREDPDVLEIMRLMQQAKEAETSPEAVEQSYQQASRLLAKEAPEAEDDLAL